MAEGGYPKLKPCSDVDDEKTQSKFIGFVKKAVSKLTHSLMI